MKLSAASRYVYLMESAICDFPICDFLICDITICDITIFDITICYFTFCDFKISYLTITIVARAKEECTLLVLTRQVRGMTSYVSI